MTRPRGQAILMRQKAPWIASKLLKRARGPLTLSRSHSTCLPQIEPRSQETGFHGQGPDRVDVMLIEEPRRVGISYPHGTPGLTSNPSTKIWRSAPSCVTACRRTDPRGGECSLTLAKVAFPRRYRLRRPGTTRVSCCGILGRGLGVSRWTCSGPHIFRAGLRNCGDRPG